jgi:hypothetical protein
VFRPTATPPRGGGPELGPAAVLTALAQLPQSVRYRTVYEVWKATGGAAGHAAGRPGLHGRAGSSRSSSRSSTKLLSWPTRAVAVTRTTFFEPRRSDRHLPRCARRSRTRRLRRCPCGPLPRDSPSDLCARAMLEGQSLGPGPMGRVSRGRAGQLVRGVAVPRTPTGGRRQEGGRPRGAPTRS